jgi:hypothetical protein
MHCIPDVSKEVSDKIGEYFLIFLKYIQMNYDFQINKERENFIIQKALWQTKHMDQKELARNRTNSQIFLNIITNTNSVNNFNEDIETINEEDDMLPT